MSSEQFQAAHDSIYSTGTRLLQYIQQIREGRRSERNDSLGLKSIEDNLNKALNALQEQKYQVKQTALEALRICNAILSHSSTL